MVVGHQCRLRGSSGACFIFRCQGSTHTHKHKDDTLWWNLQMCVTHSPRSQRQRTGPPRLTVTSALSGFSVLFCYFFFFFNGVYAFAFLLLSTFGNTHRGAKSKCSSELHTPQKNIFQSLGDLKCLNLPMAAPPSPTSDSCHTTAEER